MIVLIADVFDAAGLEVLRAAGCDVVYDPDLRGDALAAAIRGSGAQVLLVRGTVVSGAALTGSRLALVVRAGAGVNAIDVAEASRLGIRVSNCPGLNAAAVAELTMGLIIALDRSIPENVVDLRAGRWNKRRYSRAKGLAGRTLGLLGFGHIGRAVARRARAFDMRVLVWSRRFANGSALPDPTDASICALSSPHAVAADCDVLSVHLALTADTRHLVDASVLGHLKTGAGFINTSRAEIVDTGALAEAVAGGRIRAGLDVFENEPADGAGEFQTPLAALQGVYGTHHIGASTEQAQHAVAVEAVRIVLTFKATGEAPNAITASQTSRADSTHSRSARTTSATD